MSYPPSGYIIFSLRKLEFYMDRRPDMRPGTGGGQPKHSQGKTES